MSDDEPFLCALQADPDDRTARRVYADWLAERDRPREAEYVRLVVSAAELPPNADRVAVRTQLLALQPDLPAWWVALVGGLRINKGARAGGMRIEEATAALGRGVHATNTDGYKTQLIAAATCGRTGALAYIEQRSKSLPTRYDDGYVLVLRDATGRTAETPIYVYSTYAEFTVNFLEWWGDAVLLVYREKHRPYGVRFGFDGPARSARLADCWLINDRVLAFIERGQNEVKRFALPDLDALPSLSIEEATTRNLMPDAPRWWLM